MDIRSRITHRKADPPRPPDRRFLGEAIDVAKFHARYRAALRDGSGTIVRPGLELAAGGRGTKPLLSATTGAEIRSLQAAARAADTEYQFTLTRPNRAPTDEGDAVLRRMVAALRWLLDDGVEDEADVKLANLEARHDNPTTNDALASALEAYGDLADEVREELKTFEIFELSTIDQARGLAAQLRESAGPGPSSDAPKQAIELRDGLFVLLRQRMRIVRRAAEFVFQEQPEIVKELASAYDRRRRGRSRAAAEEGGCGAHGGVGGVIARRATPGRARSAVGSWAFWTAHCGCVRPPRALPSAGALCAERNQWLEETLETRLQETRTPQRRTTAPIR